MNVQSIRSTPAQDDRTAIQPIAAMGDFAPAHIPSEQQAFPLSLRGGLMPQLTGEIRSLVYIRLREVSLLVTVGWSFVLLLCLSRLDGLLNPARLGIGCIGAMMFTTVVFLMCGILLRVGEAARHDFTEPGRRGRGRNEQGSVAAADQGRAMHLIGIGGTRRDALHPADGLGPKHR